MIDIPQVIVNRLSWQRVWTIPAQDGTPTALAWRTDGQILAVGRSDATVSLLNIEDGHAMHTHTLTHPITSLHWMTQDQASIRLNGVEYKDRSLSFLPPLPSLDASDPTHTAEHTSDVRQMQSLTKEVDVLVVGDKAGMVHMCISGVFCATSVDVSSVEGNEPYTAGQESHVMVTYLSHDLKMLSSVSLIHDRQQNSSLLLHTVEVSLIHQRCRELQHLALLYAHIHSLLDYASATLRCMHNAWEDLLLMVDAKLARYSTTLREGTTVSDELLVLLACGRLRPELQDFLVDELTAKGVKKVGLSLEMSYTRVRKYSLTCLSSAIQALQFHLGEVLGMAQWHERFGVLGISVEKLQVCLKSLGTLALKNHELQSVIDESLKSMKAFFTWLYGVILKLGEESIPPNMKQHLTAEELKLVIHFLKKRLAMASEGSSQTFNLELVGQYLVDEDLKILEESPPSFWEKILKEAELNSEALPWLCSPFPKKSLLQLLNTLGQDVRTAFAASEKSIREAFVPKMSVSLLDIPMTEKKESGTISKLGKMIGEFVHDGQTCIYFPCGDDVILLVNGDGNQAMKCCRFCVRDVPALEDQKKSGESVSLLSVQVYNAEALSLLFEYSCSERPDILFTAVAQLPVNPVMLLATDTHIGDNLESHESHDIGHLLTQVHSLGPFHGTSLAVSGSRRLAAVVSRGSKKIRLFDVCTEGEEEEGEGEGEGEGKEGKESQDSTAEVKGS